MPHVPTPTPSIIIDPSPVSLPSLPPTGTTVFVKPLIDVVLVENPKFPMKITEEMFDPAIHIRSAAPLPKKASARVRPTFTAEPESELLTWTLARLRAMPEVGFINTPATAKAGLVQQILAVRN